MTSPLTRNRSIIPTHARRTHQRAVDRAILEQSPTPHQPPLSHVRHSHHSAFGRSLCRQLLLPSALAVRAGIVRDRMDSPVHRPCRRRQTAGILQRLAIPIRRRALVVGENQRQSLMWGGATSPGAPFLALLAREVRISVSNAKACLAGIGRSALCLPHLGFRSRQRA